MRFEDRQEIGAVAAENAAWLVLMYAMLMLIADQDALKMPSAGLHFRRASS